MKFLNEGVSPIFYSLHKKIVMRKDVKLHLNESIFFSLLLMPCSSRQKIHLQQISRKKQQNTTVDLQPQGSADADMMAISGIMEGTGYEAQKRTAMRMNLKPASKSSYFRS